MTTEQETTLYDIAKTAREELREWASDNPDEDEPHDAITEIADGSVPIYTHDLLSLAADNLVLATTTPEMGPAFDGEPTPTNIIAANIYEHVTEQCWEEWRLIEGERD